MPLVQLFWSTCSLRWSTHYTKKPLQETTNPNLHVLVILYSYGVYLSKFQSTGLQVMMWAFTWMFGGIEEIKIKASIESIFFGVCLGSERKCKHSKFWKLLIILGMKIIILYLKVFWNGKLFTPLKDNNPIFILLPFLWIILLMAMHHQLLVFLLVHFRYP